MRRTSLLRIGLTLNLLSLTVLLGGWLGPNVKTSFNPEISLPVIATTATVHPLAAVTGSVTLGERVYVAPRASVRADEGQNIYI